MTTSKVAENEVRNNMSVTSDEPEVVFPMVPLEEFNDATCSQSNWLLGKPIGSGDCAGNRKSIFLVSVPPHTSKFFASPSKRHSQQSRASLDIPFSRGIPVTPFNTKRVKWRNTRMNIFWLVKT